MRWKLLGVALVTSACLAISLRGAEPGAVVAAWRGLEPWRLLLVLVLHLVVLAIRTLRFRHLVTTKPAFGSLLPVMGASFLAINVVPLRMGELVRPYLLSQRGVPFADAALAVVIERLLDLVALLVLVLVATSWVDAPGWAGRELHVLGVDVVVLGRAAVASSVALGLVALGAAHRLARATRGAQPEAASAWRRTLRRLDDAFVGLGARSPRDVAVVVLCTVGSWVGSLLACGLTMGGFPTLEVSAASTLVCWAATVSAVVLVPTPGFVGSFEAGAVGALVLLGRDADAARAFALALHGIQLGATLLAGAVGFAVLGVGLPAVVRASRAR